MELKRRSFLASILGFLGLGRLIPSNVQSVSPSGVILGYPMWLESKMRRMGNGVVRFCVPNGGVGNYTLGVWVGELNEPHFSNSRITVWPDNPFVTNWVDPVKIPTPLEILMDINPVEGVLEEASRFSYPPDLLDTTKYVDS